MGQVRTLLTCSNDLFVPNEVCALDIARHHRVAVMFKDDFYFVVVYHLSS
jgi:hypothetical protein